MRDLVDSTGLFDEPSLLERFKRDGYVFLRRLLPRRAVDDAAADMRRVMVSRGWITGSSSEVVAPVPEIYGRDYWDLYSALYALESIHELPFQARLQSVMCRLLGRDAFVYPRKILRVVGPVTRGGPAKGAEPHRDFTGFGIRDMLVTWVPYANCGRQAGTLWVKSGSHRDRTLDPGRFDISDPAWESADYAPGDVVVLHCLTVHATQPNHSDEFRLSVDYRWQSATDPVPTDVLEPDVPERWNDLTRGWTSPKWISPPQSIVSYEDADDWREPTMVPTSRFVSHAEEPPARAGSRFRGLIGRGGQRRR